MSKNIQNCKKWYQEELVFILAFEKHFLLIFVFEFPKKKYLSETMYINTECSKNEKWLFSAVTLYPRNEIYNN